ncbi:MAG: LytTR family DNA-binding domain-containing protein [Firmicutes bacterium]|nr:LytTR family DNA-binding domain-containing protein [Bacillota bacterium]
MLNIAICDDEINIGAELERTLTDILDTLNIKHEIDVFLGATDFLRHFGNSANFAPFATHYDLIFLDIMFAQEKIDGVEIGKLIRNDNNISAIVYISWEKNYAMELFQNRPLDFLIKPIKSAEIERVVRTYLKIAGYMNGNFTYKKGRETFKLPIKSITHLENRKRKVILHLADGTQDEFYGSLKQLYSEQLSKFDFLFIHASYVVNYDYVTAVKFDQMTVVGGLLLPISPNRRVEIRAAYTEILKRRRL